MALAQMGSWHLRRVLERYLTDLTLASVHDLYVSDRRSSFHLTNEEPSIHADDVRNLLSVAQKLPNQSEYTLMWNQRKDKD